ncbi:hypothetical protein NFI96_004850 [Prochilodus magdalenae]|nr:hypothetical protein NFI96_004850 [Prochilodus magdalenae]
MQGLSWLCAAVVLCACGSGVDGQCWDIAGCTDLGSQEKIMFKVIQQTSPYYQAKSLMTAYVTVYDMLMSTYLQECIWQCRTKQLALDAKNVLPNQQQSTADEEENESLSLGVLLSSLAQDDTLQAKRSSTGPLRTDDRRSYSMEHFRWGKPMGRKRRPVKVHTGASVEEGSPEDQSAETQSRRQLDSQEDGAPAQKKNTKSTERYRMMHFRWNAPPAAKRYGGFMKPEKSNKPLITLLRNIIVRDGQ